jgi:hypothetical protein
MITLRQHGPHIRRADALLGAMTGAGSPGRYTFADADAMIAVACAGAGIAQLLPIGTDALIASGMLVELFPEWPDETFPLHAAKPSRRLPSAAAEAFLDFCITACAARSVRAGEMIAGQHRQHASRRRKALRNGDQSRAASGTGSSGQSGGGNALRFEPSPPRPAPARR